MLGGCRRRCLARVVAQRKTKGGESLDDENMIPFSNAAVELGLRLRAPRDLLQKVD